MSYLDSVDIEVAARSDIVKIIEQCVEGLLRDAIRLVFGAIRFCETEGSSPALVEHQPDFLRGRALLCGQVTGFYAA